MVTQGAGRDIPHPGKVLFPGCKRGSGRCGPTLWATAGRRCGSAQPAAQPWRTQLSRGSAVCAAVSREARCWQSHHVPPRQSWCSRPRHEKQIITAIVPLPARYAGQSPDIRPAARSPDAARGHRTFPIWHEGIGRQEKRTLEYIPLEGMYFMITGQMVGDSNLSDPRFCLMSRDGNETIVRGAVASGAPGQKPASLGWACP